MTPIDGPEEIQGNGKAAWAWTQRTLIALAVPPLLILYARGLAFMVDLASPDRPHRRLVYFLDYLPRLMASPVVAVIALLLLALPFRRSIEERIRTGNLHIQVPGASVHLDEPAADKEVSPSPSED